MSKEIFYEFKSRHSSSTVQAYEIEESGCYLSKGDIRNLIKGVYSGIEFPITFKQEYGKNWTDILDTGWPGRYLISNRLKDILENQHFTGWQCFPIKLFDKKSNEILGYNGFSVIGKCASIDYKKSSIIEKQYVTSGPICQFYKGVFLDEWDGSDFFCPEDTYEMFVTQKVEKELKKNKITNIYLQKIDQIETDVKFIKR